MTKLLATKYGTLSRLDMTLKLFETRDIQLTKDHWLDDYIVSRFEKIVNEKLISVFSSIIAIILAELSVQYVLDGIIEFLV